MLVNLPVGGGCGERLEEGPKSIVSGRSGLKAQREALTRSVQVRNRVVQKGEPAIPADDALHERGGLARISAGKRCPEGFGLSATRHADAA
jgi:hypothetical protein